MANERIIFLGTPEISAKLLEGLIKNNFNIVGVVTKEDKIRGRGNKIEPSPVALVADKYHIPVHKPHRLNTDYQFIEDLKPDLLLTFAYGQIIKEDILTLSRYKPLNLHASILPKYRGAAPIQYALKNGDDITGVSLMEMVKRTWCMPLRGWKKSPPAGLLFAGMTLPMPQSTSAAIPG